MDHVKIYMGHDRVWAVGPLLPADDDVVGPTKRGGSSSVPTQEVISWLNSKGNNSLVYVCFGSGWTVTSQQVVVLLDALDRSGVHFILVVKESDVARDASLIPKGFEDRVANRGFIIKGWAPQVAILRHLAVGAFVTHCGWNSVLEGLAAGVVMLTWPLGADQFTNAQLLVDQLGVAVRFCEVGTRTIPDPTELARILAESVGSCKSQRDRVMELRSAASEAILGGSSSRDMDELVKNLHGLSKCVAILKHRAVGAFVPDCGWNSVLERLVVGMVMLMRYLGVDQFINANLLVEQPVRFCEVGTRKIANSAESVGGCKSQQRDRVMELPAA
ncbi:flavonol 3-O-glucosyltransferase UGT89B1-like [Actinidia eriantha]|uniref:flavonol 3-O-glucosyltransferase UGT89B1-like n=1 Tax=Actinidia eriantha TaxID=165200 RepID=UPI00258BC30F|nr:flavonol 3-O-glucosyltransferase UGT89B1-like [Actinidia eriantha]